MSIVLSCVGYWPTLLRSQTVRVVCAWSDCCLVVFAWNRMGYTLLKQNSLMPVIVSGSEF